MTVVECSDDDCDDLIGDYNGNGDMVVADASTGNDLSKFEAIAGKKFSSLFWSFLTCHALSMSSVYVLLLPGENCIMTDCYKKP